MFKIKNLRKIQKILNILIIYNFKMRTLHLNQTHYINKILKNLYIIICNLISIKSSIFYLTNIIFFALLT